MAGAHAAIQAGRSRCAATLCCSGARFTAGSVGYGAPPEPNIARLRHSVRAGALVRLESCFVSAGNDLVLQSVCLATNVLLRCMVRYRRRGQNLVSDQVSRGACDIRCVDSLRVPDRDDLAQRLSRIVGPEMDDQGDLPDR